MNTNLPRRRFLHSALALSALPYAKLLAADSPAPPDVEAVTGDGKQVLLKGTDVKDFAARLRGELLLASSAGYDTVRRAWNGAFDRHPALIARCTGAADVMQAVSFAASHNLLLSVRGGGHSLSGQCVCEKGLMIDLSQMNGVRVDPVRRRAFVEGGTLLGALDRESLAHGLVTTAGTVSHTGVGGLTLGGGFGRLSRRFALACDNVRSIDLVTANGKWSNVSAESDKELLWGLRGGGGNFGVATAFEFQLHPIDPVMLGGVIAYAWEDAPKVLQYYFEHSAGMPDELNVDAAAVRLPNDQRMVTLDVCYCGPHATGEKLLEPLRKIAKPIADDVKPTPYATLQTMDDQKFDHGQRYYVKAGFRHQYSPKLLDAVIAPIADAKLPAVQVVALPQAGGAIARIKSNATAFAQRGASGHVLVISSWRDPALNDAVAEWTRTSWKRIEPLTHGFYVNDYTPEDAARLSTTYGGNFDRLVALKAKVDPNNLFRLNANIAPKARLQEQPRKA
jgi:FAD/FMN-containing dehydrogenase